MRPVPLRIAITRNTLFLARPPHVGNKCVCPISELPSCHPTAAFRHHHVSKALKRRHIPAAWPGCRDTCFQLKTGDGARTQYRFANHNISSGCHATYYCVHSRNNNGNSCVQTEFRKQTWQQWGAGEKILGQGVTKAGQDRSIVARSASLASTFLLGFQLFG